jgi:hypothetical protein
MTRTHPGCVHTGRIIMTNTATADLAALLQDVDLDTLRTLLASKVDQETQLRNAQTTAMVEEEGGRTFFEGIISRTTDTVTTRSVGRAWDNIAFTAADGTEYVGKVWLTDVKKKAALPAPAPRKKA